MTDLRPTVNDINAQAAQIHWMQSAKRQRLAQQRRKQLINIMRVLIAAGVIVIVLAAFALGVALVVG